MPLASTFGLQWYGPGMCSMVFAANAGDLYAQPKGNARAAVALSTDAQLGNIRAVPLRRANMVLPAGLAGMVVGPRGRGRIRMILGPQDLTKADVTGAVMESLVEPGLTLKQAMRLMLAAMVGKVSGAAGPTVVFRNPADTKDRITAVVSGGNRTAVNLDPSDG